MGNRAVVTVSGSKVGVYLHWNGGPESVRAFLRAAKDLGVRDPESDPSYFYARFAQIVGNFFGGTTSVGVGALEELDTDNGDNGVFVIGAGFKITRREHAKYAAHDVKGKPARDKENAVYLATMAANRELLAESDYQANGTRTATVSYIPEDAGAPTAA